MPYYTKSETDALKKMSATLGALRGPSGGSSSGSGSSGKASSTSTYSSGNSGSDGNLSWRGYDSSRRYNAYK